MSGTRQRIATLDHLRATAIVLVLFVHYLVYHDVPTWLIPFAAVGWTGVDLFFVLSGYLIGHMLITEVSKTNKINFTKFYVNRALRILPAYFFVLGIYYFFPGLGERNNGLQPLWRFITFTQNLPSRDLSLNAFSHAWSLAVEEHFYLLFPLLLLGVARLKLGRKVVAVFVGIFVLGLLSKYLSWHFFVAPLRLEPRFIAYFEWFYYPSFNHFDGLTFGVGIAAIKAARPDLHSTIRKFRYAIIGAGMISLTAAWLLIRGRLISPQATELPSALFLYTLVALGFACFVLLGAYGNASTSVFATVSRYLAIWSYSVYLTHKMVFQFVNTQVIKVVELGLLPGMFVSFALSIAVGATVYYLVEMPFMKFRSSLRMNRQDEPIDKSLTEQARGDRAPSL